MLRKTYQIHFGKLLFQSVNLCHYKFTIQHFILRHKFFDARDPHHHQKEKKLIVTQSDYFENAAKDKIDKENFHKAIAMYIVAEKIRRRGHVEFIYAAMKQMKRFSVHKDLDTYKMLIRVFPTEILVPKGPWEVEWQHFPKQQQCAIDLMEMMEDNLVIPDDEFGYMLRDVFGDQAHAFRRYRRMMYWMPKFKNANPYQLPLNLPSDERQLALLALKRMCIDLETEYTTYETENLNNSIDKTFIVSAQSWRQKQLIESHDIEKPLFVEGGYTVWLRDKKLQYFKLRAEADPDMPKHYFPEDIKKKSNETGLFNLKTIFDEETSYAVTSPNVMHQQPDGTILGLCITGTNSKNSLISWVNFLQLKVKQLCEIPVLFTLKNPEDSLTIFKEEKEFNFNINKTK